MNERSVAEMIHNMLFKNPYSGRKSWIEKTLKNNKLGFNRGTTGVGWVNKNGKGCKATKAYADHRQKSRIKKKGRWVAK